MSAGLKLETYARSSAARPSGEVIVSSVRIKFKGPVHHRKIKTNLEVVAGKMPEINMQHVSMYCLKLVSLNQSSNIQPSFSFQSTSADRLNVFLGWTSWRPGEKIRASCPSVLYLRFTPKFQGEKAHRGEDQVEAPKDHLRERSFHFSSPFSIMFPEAMSSHSCWLQACLIVRVFSSDVFHFLPLSGWRETL